MQLIVRDEIWERFPGMEIAIAVARGVDNTVPHPSVADDWRATWDGAAALAHEYENAQAHPHVAAWRTAFREMGLAPRDFRSSIEALLRRAMRGGEPFSISPLVDFYNAVSLAHIVPVGGFDLGDISGPIEVRLTRAGDTYHGLDSDERIAIPPGEVAYVDGSVLLTRHFVWRQSREGMVTPETRDGLLLTEVLGAVGPAVTVEALAAFRDGFETHFGITPFTATLTAANPAVEMKEINRPG
jgi:DNA/RNA-binding domain of Phe-tRNA-synthetase-like protein